MRTEGVMWPDVLDGALAWIQARAPALVAVALAGMAVGLHYAALQRVPPGFFSDEASVAYDALGIATDGRDQHGAAWPVVFQSFGAWRCPLFIYAVAAVFKVFGPGVIQARAVATTCSLLTAALLGLLVWRLFSTRWLAMGAFLVASVTPWLLTTGRSAFEPITLPLVLAAFLVVWQRADSSGDWRWGIAGGAVLGLAVYTYISAWLYAPLLCVALALSELPRVRWRLMLATSVGAGVVALPLALFLRGHPGALTARYHVVQVWQTGHPLLENLGRLWRVYTSGFSPGYLFGQVFFIQGGELFSILAAALAVGLFALWGVRRDRFWRFCLLGLLLAPVPGALSADFSHDLRNLEGLPFYFAIMALGVWRLSPALTRERVAAVALTGLLATQTIWFLSDYFTRVDGRMAGWQVAGFGQAVQDAVRLARGRPIELAPDLYAAESGDPQTAAVPFAFFSGEPVPLYRREGIRGMNASIVNPDQRFDPGIAITTASAQPPHARLLERVTVPSVDDWGQRSATPVFLIWSVGP
jgi:4-amino-4-deoxy-L-arabinose transferase-like glycosyltransferase